MAEGKHQKKIRPNLPPLMPSELWAGWQVCHLRRRYHGRPAALATLENARRDWALQQKLGRLDTLAHDLGIDLNSRSGPLALALRLAEKYEPGFQDEAFEQPVRRRGRKARKVIDYLQLLLDVHEKMDKANLTFKSQACRALAGRGRWKGFSSTALQKAVSRAGAELVPLDTSHPLVTFLIEKAEDAERTAAEQAAAIERAAISEKIYDEELAKSPCDRNKALLIS